MKVENMNVLSLAYLGDAVYEINIRKHLLEQNIANVKDLQKESINYVSANSQAFFLKKMFENDFLYQEEKEIVLRARNHKVGHKPKNSDIVTYKWATGLEALIGYLYLKKQNNRIEEILNYIKGVEK